MLDCLLPEKESSLREDEDKSRLKLEADKREYFSNFQQPRVAFLVEKVLPKVFSVFDNNMNQQVRTKILQVIDKLL